MEELVVETISHVQPKGFIQKYLDIKKKYPNIEITIIKGIFIFGISILVLKTIWRIYF